MNMIFNVSQYILLNPAHWTFKHILFKGEKAHMSFTPV